MEPFEIKYETDVLLKDIPRLTKEIGRRIERDISTKLSSHPEIFGIPLRQSLRLHRKLRVGDYRVIYRIQGHMVKIFAIGHRAVVYKELLKRLGV